MNTASLAAETKNKNKTTKSCLCLFYFFIKNCILLSVNTPA